MKSYYLLTILASVILFANPLPYATDNPYENISTIEEKQIKGDNFVEVYKHQNNISESTFTFFDLIESENTEEVPQDCSIDPLTGECFPTDVPLPAPINNYQYLLLIIGVGGLFIKFRK